MPPFKMYFFVSFIFFFVVNWKADSGMDKGSIRTKSDSLAVNNSAINDSLKQAFKASDIDKAFSFFIDSLQGENETLHDASISTGKIKNKKFIDKVRKRVKLIIQEKASRKLFFQKAIKYASWMLFLLMPIFALLLMMLHWRRKKYYVSHLVFAVNMHTFIFLILTIMLLITSDAKGYLFFLIPFYTVLSMKKFYNQPWGKTILKFFILTTLYNFVLLAAFISVFVISFGTF